MKNYRDQLKCLYVVARSLLLLLLTCSAWLWLGPAQQDLHTFLPISVLDDDLWLLGLFCFCCSIMLLNIELRPGYVGIW